MGDVASKVFFSMIIISLGRSRSGYGQYYFVFLFFFCIVQAAQVLYQENNALVCRVYGHMSGGSIVRLGIMRYNGYNVV